MANTPEGRVKRKISQLLVRHGCYYDMPVPGGYGKSTIDYHGCHYGMFFGIEAKAPGKKPTKLQEIILAEIRAAGGKAFVIDGDTTELDTWLHSLKPPTTTSSPIDGT